MRHLARTLAGVVLILAVLVVSAVIWRTQLAEVAGTRWLAAQGFGKADFAVKRLSLSHVVVTDVDLGSGAPQAERISATFTANDLLHGTLKSLEIRGLRATVDPLSGDRSPWLPRSTGATTATETETGDGAWSHSLPRIALRDARIVVQVPGTPDIPVQFQGQLRPENGLAVTFEANARERFAQARLEGTLTDLATEPSGQLDGAINADLATLPVAWRNALAIPTGRFSLRLRHEGRLPALQTLTGPERRIPDTGQLEITAKLRDATSEPYAEGLTASGTLAAHATDGELRITAPDPITLRTEGGRAAAWERLGLPDELARLFTTKTRTEITPREAGAPLLRVRPVAAGWRLDAAAAARGEIGTTGGLAGGVDAVAMLDADLGLRRAKADPVTLTATGLPLPWGAVNTATYRGTAALTSGTYTARGTLSATAASARIGEASARDIRMKAPLTARFAGGDDAEIALRAPGWLHLVEVTAPGGVSVAMPERIAVPDASAALSPAGVRVSAVTRPGTIRIGDTIRTNGGRITVSVAQTGSGLRLDGAVSDASATVPGAALAARGISGTVAMPPGAAPRGDLTVASLRHTAATPAFKPLSINAAVTASEGAYRLDGAVSFADATLEVPVEGRFDPATGTGRLRVPPTPIRFAPGGLQPAALSPLLADATKVSGTLTPAATLSLGANGLSSTGELAIDGLDATLPFCTISNLNGTLALDSLVPPRTAGVQTVTADTITAALPLADVEARVRLDAAANGKPIVHVAEATGKLAEGEVSLRNIVWTQSATRVDAPVHISGMSLSKLIEEIGVEDISGTGNLVGTIPVRVEDGAALVDDGTLRATGPGQLRVRLGAAESLKAAGGEHVTLMLRALENFQYDVLSIGVNRPTPGEMKATVTLGGRNPDVLDGYPFRFNVNISGDMRPLLEALRRGRALSADLLNNAISVQ
ncbi:Dicarboxylate transport [Limimonas halophila]|uniref:Dicarboxylate transport n=1 Tax=Limimonas halophila TaxID=1082479 RepID=A0A1G7NT34_9PROT|nr:YdbH domain-containing protein [Limimonas halophila]SDF77278.1 Dicarboxylate transport [Limimonas halophila]